MAARPVYNRNFFDVIDTEEKAYFLGILYSDGCIIPKEKKIQLVMCDLDVIEKFKKALDSPATILTPKPYTSNRKQPYKIQIFGEQIMNAVISHGCTPKKSNTLQAPKTVPDKLVRHFIRGYFDGDGSITTSIRRDRNRQTINVSMVGTNSVMLFIREKLVLSGILCGAVTKHKCGIEAYYIDIYRNSILDLAEYFYYGSSVWMNRKYDKFVNLATETHGRH